ncbi:mediator of RNA polymerase II transcription subunit 15 [Bactrocera oleae]|uniref:mediator of RNA polymerase II transcription subunit 15 n=1 Tax=Bactrocera oleae TaxID=104688 RepID=UPI00387EA3B6
MEKTCYLRIPLLLLVCSLAVCAENVANISDSLAVETAVDTVRVTSSIAPATKSKTEKRDSSDQKGPTAFTHKEASRFRPVTRGSYQQLPPQPQQFQSSPAPTPFSFQPTTVRYISEEAAPQAYYDRPPNVGTVSGPSSGGKFSNFVDDNIHYGIPIHTFRGPFKGPYQQHLEQLQPQSLHHQQQYQLKHQYNQQAAKLPPNLSYSPTSVEGGFIPSERQLQQEQPPQHYKQQHMHTQQQQQNEQYSQQIQHQQPVIQKHSQQQQSYVAIEKQSQPQLYQQQQQQQYQQPSRQQIHYIIAIPLSYVRQLQYQLAAQHGATPLSQQQQAPPSAPVPLAAPRAPLSPLLVLQPVGASGGGGSSSSLSRELYRTQQPIHYVSHAPASANPAAGPHVESPPALTPQQLLYPMNLVPTALARPRPAVYPSSQLLYVQPQLIRHTPQQQLQLQVKQPHHLPHYAHASDQQQTHAIEERNTQLSKPSQPQQYPPSGTPRGGPKPKVSQVSSPSPSSVTSSASPLPAPPQLTTALPIQSPLPIVPPVLFYGPTFVQPPQPEQLSLPPSPYASYFQGQIGAAQHASALVKLSSPSALLAPQTALTPPHYHMQSPPGGSSPLQLQQSSLQHQPPALSAFSARTAVYVAPQDAVDSIGGPPWSGGRLPFFIHPAGVHYGTHLYDPGTPLVTQKLLENVPNGDVDNQQQQHLRPEQDRKQQQQQLDSTATSGGNDDNNAIVKYP